MFSRLLFARPRFGALVLLAVVILAGCEHKSTDNPPDKGKELNTATENETATKSGPLTDTAVPAGSTNNDSAEVILKKMTAAYQSASNYSDSGEFTFVREINGEERTEEPLPVSVTFERPNKLRMHAFFVSAVADGKKLLASISGLSDQVLSVESPQNLNLDSLNADPILADAMQGGMFLPQLKLLTADDPLADDLQDAEPPKRLSDRKLGEDICQRVSVTSPAGERVYWIDFKNHVLRRMQFPAVEFKKIRDPENKLTSLTLTATFNGAAFERKLPPEVFMFEVPERAKLVKYFLPPGPEAPSALLGQKLDQFTFEELDGTKVDASKFAGKIVVVDVWASWCAWCFKGFPNLEKVYQRFKDNDKIMIVTLNTDTPDVSNDEVQALFDKEELHLPILRDTKNQAGDLLGVSAWPTMFVLGPDGTVEFHSKGYDADLAQTLPIKLEKLLAGEGLVAEQLESYKVAREEYDKKMTEALGGTTVEVEVPQTKIGPRSAPAKLKSTELWKNTELKRPGNLLVVSTPDQPDKIFANSGVHDVVELDATGKIIATHALELPDDAVISFVRTGVDGDGKRYFAAFASGEQQVHLFDDQWKKLLSYPDPRDGNHPGIMDVHFADLDGDKHLEFIVAYGGVVGVQCVSITGERIWSNRALENIFSMAITRGEEPATSILLCASARDRLTTIDYTGKTGVIVSLANRGLHTIAAADKITHAAGPIAGLSSSQVGKTDVLGIDLANKELWSYELPAGVHQLPVPVLSPVQVLKDSPGQWLAAGADGSLHLLAFDGKLIDKFNYGEVLAGVASGTIGGEPVLFVATPTGVSAWKLTGE